MSLSPRLDGFVVPDTPLFHSVIKPAIVNSRKHRADGARANASPTGINYLPSLRVVSRKLQVLEEKNNEWRQEKCILQ